MNATVTLKEAVRTDSLVRDILRDIPLDKIYESSTNPRAHFDERGLANVRSAEPTSSHGFDQPLRADESNFQA